MSVLIIGSGLEINIVPEAPVMSIVSLFAAILASMIACRSVPGPESEISVTGIICEKVNEENRRKVRKVLNNKDIVNE